MGTGYQRTRTPEALLVFSIKGEDRVDAGILTVDGKYLFTLAVLGPDPQSSSPPARGSGR